MQTLISKVVQHKILCRFMLFFHDFKAKNSKKFDYYNENMSRIHIFKCIYLDEANDSDDVVKTKNTQFFMIFSNISFFHMIVNYWTGSLNLVWERNFYTACLIIMLFIDWCRNIENPWLTLRDYSLSGDKVWRFSPVLDLKYFFIYSVSKCKRRWN